MSKPRLLKLRWLFVLAPLFSIGSGTLFAIDPPHDYSVVDVVGTPRICYKCHNLHHAAGGNLNSIDGNANLCMSCHTSGGDADPFVRRLDEQAIPGVTGNSHRWDAPVVNPSRGSNVPADPQLAARLPNGNIMCSTCHNQHNYAARGNFGRRNTQPRPFDTNTSLGRVTSNGAFNGAVPVTYWIRITVAGTASTARFQWMKDGGSWSGNTVPGVDVALDDGVTVSFYDDGGNFSLNDQWTMEAIIPFLRVDISMAQLCEECHAERVMDHNAVETWTGGFLSHPVGIALGANGKGYDHPSPRDIDGAAQGASTDRNNSNDLQLFGGTVRCLTCHGIHRVDTDSATIDSPPPPP